MLKLLSHINYKTCQIFSSYLPTSQVIRENESTDLPFYRKHFISIAKVLEYHSLFIFLILIFSLSAICVSVIFPTSIDLSFSLYDEIMGLSALLFLPFFFLWRVIVMAIYDKPKHPIRYFLQVIRKNYLTPEMITTLAIFMLFFPLFSSSFTYLKSMIPFFNSYSWDPFLANLDRMIHFGYDPWRLLQPAFGYPSITMVINILYNMWMFFWYFYLFYMFFSLNKKNLRMQFLLSFILCWGIIGVIMATLFSSAGPCYFTRLYVNDPYFNDLMTYLNMANKDHSIWALNTQNVLWQRYKEVDLGVGSGISAMPSMHVCITFLITLTHYQINRKIGLILLLYTLIIFFGSIHLGWHYAIDGYLSIITTYAIWRCVGYFIKKDSTVFKYSNLLPIKT